MSVVQSDLARIEAEYCSATWGKAAIFTDGPKQWYALRVVSQREDHAEQWLELRGVYAFHPVTTRRVRRCGVLREHHRRYLPGYVFARFPGCPVEHAVLASPFITGALSFQASGEWGALDPSQLQAIHAMRRKDAEDRATRKAEAARRKRASLVRKGDSAMFRSGPLSQYPCEVIELRADGGARVAFRLFGRDVVADAIAEDLVTLRVAS